MKGIQETPFGTLFQSWPLKPLSDVAFFQEGPGLRKWQWTESGMKVINVTNILGDGSVDVNNTSRFISSDEFEKKYRHFAVDAGDTVVASSGNTYGKVGRVNHSHLPIMMNTSVIRFHPADPQTLDHNFLFAFLRSHLFKNQMESFVIGSAQPNFGPSHLKRMVIPCPDFTIQRKIGEILSAYDNLIENNTRRIAILEAMAQAIYREWFLEFGFPGHEKVKLVDSPLGKIPEGWEVKSLGKVAVITMGTSPKGDTYNEEGNGTPLVNGPVEFGERFTRPIKWTTAPSKFCKEGDLVVCVRGSTTGKHVKSDGVYCLGRGVCALSSQYQCFVDLLFKNEMPTLLAQAGGSTFPSWTGPQIANHPVVYPPVKFLNRFEELVGPMSAAILVHSRRIQNLRTTRDLLLPKLISGQLDVEDLDIDAGEPETE